MNQLVAEDQNIKTSSVYIGFLILSEIKKNKSKRVTIYKISEILNKNGIKNSRQLILGLSFLYSLGIIEFEEPYLCVK